MRQRANEPGRPVPGSGSEGAAGAAAGELLAATRAELPALTELGEREQLLVATWLVSLRSARTRRAYFGALASWLAWLSERQLDPLTASRVQVDMGVRANTYAGAKPSTIRRRLSALSSWYRYLAAHDVIAHQPVAGVVRPWVDPDHSETIGLDRDQARGPERGSHPARCAGLRRPSRPANHSTVRPIPRQHPDRLPRLTLADAQRIETYNNVIEQFAVWSV